MLTQKMIFDALLASMFSISLALGVWFELEKLFDFICEKGIDKKLVEWYN